MIERGIDVRSWQFPDGCFVLRAEQKRMECLKAARYER